MNDLQEYIIWKINRLSDEKNWSINRLAIEANLTQSTLSNIISKKAIPNIKTIDAICKTDLASGDWLFGFDIFQSIMDVDNRVTIEKIVLNKIPIFDVNVFDFSTGEKKE